MSNHFDKVPQEPPDAIFGLVALFKQDTSAHKVDLVVGAYRDDHGKPWVLPVVRKVEELQLRSEHDHEYLPLDGYPAFVEGASKLLLGKDSPALREKRVASVQALSGSGSLRVGGEFLARHYPSKEIYIPNPTWANHNNLFADAGLKPRSYRYYDQASIALDFAGLTADLKAAPEGSVFLFHSCAHNPTGIDPSREQWKEIAKIVKERNHLPFFDTAYQGFATGDLDNDAYAVRLFVDEGIEFLSAQSFAKNMGLYGERVGNFMVVCNNKEAAEHALSQLKRIIRGMVSNCPTYGAWIAGTIMSDPALFKEWDGNVKEMANRIKDMRKALHDKLIELKTPGDWSHIMSQIGMFTFTGLTAPQCESMMKDHHIYLTKNGRISMAGLNTHNVTYVAEAINKVVTSASHL